MKETSTLSVPRQTPEDIANNTIRKYKRILRTLSAGSQLKFMEGVAAKYLAENIRITGEDTTRRAQHIMEKARLYRILEEMKLKAELAKKFDRRKYDHTIFHSAIVRYEKVKGYDRHYGRCLLAELKNRGIAKDGYEDTEDFLNYSNAFRQYRYDERVKSKLRKK